MHFIFKSQRGVWNLFISQVCELAENADLKT